MKIKVSTKNNLLTPLFSTYNFDIIKMQLKFYKKQPKSGSMLPVENYKIDL